MSDSKIEISLLVDSLVLYAELLESIAIGQTKYGEPLPEIRIDAQARQSIEYHATRILRATRDLGVQEEVEARINRQLSPRWYVFTTKKLLAVDGTTPLSAAHFVGYNLQVDGPWSEQAAAFMHARLRAGRARTRLPGGRPLPPSYYHVVSYQPGTGYTVVGTFSSPAVTVQVESTEDSTPVDSTEETR